jgi:hypothetical protein
VWIEINRLSLEYSGEGLANIARKLHFNFLMVVGVNFGASWNAQPCTLIETYRHSGRKVAFIFRVE